MGEDRVFYVKGCESLDSLDEIGETSQHSDPKEERQALDVAEQSDVILFTMVSMLCRAGKPQAAPT